MEYDNYRKTITPHLPFFKEQIDKNKDKCVIFKIKDIRNEMGSDFTDKHDNTIYSRLRDILLENGIKVMMDTHKDGDKLLIMKTAKPEEIISTAEIRKIRQQKAAINAGFSSPTEYVNNRNYIIGIYQGPESENKGCARYFGEYIEQKYVSQIFEDPIPFKGPHCGQHCEKKYDFECKNGFKVKHIASCVRIDNYHVSYSGDPIPYWGYLIRKNNVPDYWILSAWDNRESLEPLYVWIINGHQEFKTRYSYRENNKPFWDRATWIVRATNKGIDRMSKYDASDKLNQLKEVCRITKQI